MPDTSLKLGLSLPLSSETFTRETYRQNLLQIDEKAAAQSQVDEPFFLKSAIYNSGLNQIDLTFGKGRTNFNGIMVNKTIDSSYNISSPTINTDYYIYLQNDGSYLHNTTGTAVAGDVLLWKVQTGTTADQLTTTDLRDQLPGASAKAVYDSLQQEVNDLAGTGRTTETVKGNADALSTHSADSSNAHGINNIWYTVNTHLADYVRQPGYGITGGSANAYTLTLNPALSAYTAGVCVAVKIHAANTGASTINANGLGAKTILDSKGNALTSGKLILNSVYTMRYDGTNFILQGEGGSGNATASDLLSGKTASVDAGDITGTMPNRAGDTACISSSVSGTTLKLLATDGYRDGVDDNVTITDADFLEANILESAEIFGLQGVARDVNKYGFFYGKGTEIRDLTTYGSTVTFETGYIRCQGTATGNRFVYFQLDVTDYTGLVMVYENVGDSNADNRSYLSVGDSATDLTNGTAWYTSGTQTLQAMFIDIRALSGTKYVRAGSRSVSSGVNSDVKIYGFILV